MDFLMAVDTPPKEITVMAYSGYKANERPLSFEVKGRKYTVTNIADRWYGEDDDYFKVAADDGKVYIIKWNRPMDRWFLVRVLERLGIH
jgi:hypothetical protein